MWDSMQYGDQAPKMSGTQQNFAIRQLSQQFWMISSHLVGETGRAGRELETHVKLGHEISFLTGTLLHGMKGSFIYTSQVLFCQRIDLLQ